MPVHFHLNTPLLESVSMSKLLGSTVYLKMENSQPSGSFKIRGIGHLCQQVGTPICHKVYLDLSDDDCLMCCFSSPLGPKVSSVLQVPSRSLLVTFTVFTLFTLFTNSFPIKILLDPSNQYLQNILIQICFRYSLFVLHYITRLR